MYVKKVIYKNELGMELSADNRTVFCENIDAAGVAGNFITEAPAFAPGQITIDSQIAARVIPCSFAFRDTEAGELQRMELAEIFSPLLSGTLTVWGEENVYTIECRPQAVPSFKRDQSVPYIWRFDVDFVADYPFWQYGSEHSFSTECSLDFVFAARSKLALPLPVQIEISDMAEGEQYAFFIAAKKKTSDRSYYTSDSFSFYGKANTTFYVDGRTLRVKDSDGHSVNAVSSGSDSEIAVRYGYNYIWLQQPTGTVSYSGRATIRWHNLSLGAF